VIISSEPNILRFLTIRAIYKNAVLIIFTGDLNLDYEQRLKATDMPSINGDSTEVS